MATSRHTGEQMILTVEERSDALVVALARNLDIYTVPKLWRALESLLPGNGTVVVDLTGIDLIDSAGLGALVSLRNRLGHDGHRLGVAFGRSASVFRVAGLSSAFVGAADSAAVLSRLQPAGGDDPPLRAEGLEARQRRA